MTYYAHILDDTIHSHGECKLLGETFQNIPIPKEVYDNIQMYKYCDGQIVLNDDYESELLLEERRRISMLSLTKREVFLALYKAKQITPDALKQQITDPEALIEIEYANEYYRGNPLIDAIGAKLGITPEQLDTFFETNDYTKLI
jgi:hypothetical protein